MAVTMQQIADIAGVSRGTVDRAINNRGRINPEVKDKILKIANNLGYISRKEAKKKASKKSYKIGVITQLSDAPFMIDINRGIRDAASELADLGIKVVLKESKSVDKTEQLSFIDELTDEKVDAIAMMPVDSEDIREKINALSKADIPVLTFNSDLKGCDRLCFVGMNNTKSGQTSAGLMSMLCRGKGKILVVTGFFSNKANNHRVAGFVEELRKNYPEIIIAGVNGSFDKTEEVYKIVSTALSKDPDINGVFVVSGGQKGIEQAFSEFPERERPYCIVYDNTPFNREALKKGIFDFMIDQNGYSQGFKSIKILSDYLVLNIKPAFEELFVGNHIKTKQNI